MDHDELIKEAEKLAKDKKTHDLAHLAFVYSYVANHELQLVIERLSSLTKLVWGLLAAIVLTLGTAVVGIVFRVLVG